MSPTATEERSARHDRAASEYDGVEARMLFRHVAYKPEE